MSTPILNAKQQKSTLSAKKSRMKETIKNVLSTPYRNTYWPVVPAEDEKKLKEILEKNLPRMMEEKINVPWKDLKNIVKADRKKFRQEFTKNMHLEKVDIRESGNLYLGVNYVTKLVENALAGVVLISSDVEPRLMVQHIIDLCILYKVPVLIVQNLRMLLQSHCGISSTSLAIRKNVPSEAKLFLIKQETEQIFKKIPAPVDHMNYNRSLDDSVIVVEDEVRNKEVKTKENLLDEQIIKNVVYLKRIVKNRRTFIPPLEGTDNKMEIDGKCFIPIFQKNGEIPKVKVAYKSLVVKRLKGDHNRKKRKSKLVKISKTRQ